MKRFFWIPFLLLLTLFTATLVNAAVAGDLVENWCASLDDLQRSAQTEDWPTVRDSLAENKPFPLPELFCLARIAPVRGRRCVIYRLDEKKTPVMWENANYVYHLGEKRDILSPNNEEKRGPAR